MPPAAVLAIEEDDDGVSLIRYAADGSFAGDTWHETIEYAQQQAEFEFGKTLSSWIEVPPELKNIVAFGLAQE